MKIERFAIFTVEIPMRFSISHTLARRRTARNILVQAVDEDGRSGWGESCPRPYVTGETIDTATADLAGTILPSLIGARFADLGEAAQCLSEMSADLPRSRLAAFCAAELAVLDLAGKTFGASAGVPTGPIVRRRVRYGGVIAASEPSAVRKHAVLIRLFGFRDVKVKVQRSLEQNIQILRAARAILGTAVALRIDANGAWSAEEAVRQIDRLSSFGLEAVEQPVAAGDIEGMTTVTAAKLLPVVADESLCSLEDADALIEQRAADVFNLRASKCGGLINSMRICRRACQAGLGCQVGAQVGETAILSAAGRQLAARCPSVLWCEGSYGELLLKRDIAGGMTMGFGGRASAVESPGLGIEPDLQHIARYLKETTEVRSYAAVSRL